MYQPPSDPNHLPDPPKRKRKLWHWLVGVFVGIIVLFSLCGYIGSKLPASATLASTPTAAPAATHIPTTATTQTTIPTVKPTVATTAVGSAPAGEPGRLGGTLSTFAQRYGPPNDHSSGILYHFKRYSGSNIDLLVVMTGIAEGDAYANLAETITVQSPSSNWSATQADAACSPFYPTDAVYQRQVTAQNGYDKIYYSASLAKVFPAGAFIDSQQNMVRPGLFDVSFVAGTDGAVDSCIIGPGTQSSL